MLLRNKNKDPKQFIRLGMLSLAIMLVWPRFVPVTGGLGVDAIDGVRGVLLGASLALFFLGARFGGFRRGVIK
jgi:hypothetical protein